MVEKNLGEVASACTYAPLISIITLSYNSPDIFAAIDSVFYQNYPNIEYIFVDDSSTDYSKQEIVSYINTHKKDNIKEVKTFFNEENLGITKSGNIALRAVAGKYVFYLAGDDVFHDESVVKDWVTFFNENKSKVVTAYRDVYDAKMDNFILREPTEENVEMIKNLSVKDIFEKMASHNLVFGCCTAFSKECLDKYGPYNEDYKYIDDYPLILKIVRCGEKIAFFDRVVVKYRRGGISAFENVGNAYLEEKDRIFQNEVLPYVGNSVTAEKKYSLWKKELKRTKDHALYMKNKEAVSSEPIKRFFLTFRYVLTHPYRLCAKIKGKLEKN